MKQKRQTNRDPVTVSFTVLIDGREKAPYQFTGLHADARQQNRPLIVPTQWAHLETGDYTVLGLESEITVERKSLSDLYSTLGQHRARFEREHQRLAELRRAMVIIEAGWYEALNWPPPQSQLNPKTVFRTAVSWQVRYGVPWILAEDRRFAEIYTFRFLEKAWKEFRNGETEVAAEEKTRQ